jgi:hypothetical protein
MISMRRTAVPRDDFLFGNHPALTDTDLGFRVVLVTGP